MAVLKLHPKAQRQVGAGLSLDAAAKLAKLPELEQVKRLDEFRAQGEKPTARNVENKLREGSGKAPALTPSARIKLVLAALDTWEAQRKKISSSDDGFVAAYSALEGIRALLTQQPVQIPNGAAQPAAEEARFGA